MRSMFSSNPLGTVCWKLLRLSLRNDGQTTPSNWRLRYAVFQKLGALASGTMGRT